jgi:hypothetical protein
MSDASVIQGSEQLTKELERPFTIYLPASAGFGRLPDA